VYGLYKYRLRHAIRLQKMRNSIARDLHDEVGSNLSSISLFNEVAKENVANKISPQVVLPILEKIAEYTSVSQEAMSDIVWMINARNDSFENVVARMQSFAAEVLEAKGINLKMEVDKNSEHLKMEMHQRKNFYLIFKEAINNIAKYADCKNVNVQITNSNTSIKMKIIDDGKGFDLAAVNKGNGLLNMKKRTEEMNGKIFFNSTIGGGTTTELKFQI
jgi:signal transduction histidine kinase